MGFQDSWWTMSTSILVILGLHRFLRYRVEKPTDKHTNADEHPNHVTAIGVNNKGLLLFK